MTEEARIHPTAIISPAAELAADVRVGPYSVIDAEVSIDQGTVIGSHTVIHGPTGIGKDNRIFDFVAVGGDPQDKKYAGEKTRLEIGNGNTIREYCTLNRGTAQDDGVTRIGDDNWLMAYVHIAHDCQLGSHIIMANNASLAGHVHMHDYVICSGMVGFHQYCQIGAHSFIGPSVKIGRDVPPYIMVFGEPGSPRGINSEGLKRRGFSTEQIRNLKEAYRILYRSGLRLAEAHDKLKELADTQPELRILVDFLGRSERSILR